MKILFSSESSSYNEFSNFAPYAFIDNKGDRWATVEHYFQAHKYIVNDVMLFLKIKNNTNPYDALKLGRSGRTLCIRDWDKIKDDVMRDAILFKFTQHVQLYNMLINTGDAELIEDTNNEYWARGKNGTGKNKLGILLMELRNSFIKQQKEIIKCK